jgi:hypothetical protein
MLEIMTFSIVQMLFHLALFISQAQPVFLILSSSVANPEFFTGEGAWPYAVYNLCLILKIML